MGIVLYSKWDYRFIDAMVDTYIGLCVVILDFYRFKGYIAKIDVSIDRGTLIVTFFRRFLAGQFEEK